MKLLKRNQVIIYVIVLMIMTAGYLNYTTNTEQSLETSIQMEAKDDMQIANVGDATLVSSNDIASENVNNTNDNSNGSSDENSVSDESSNTVSENIGENQETQETSSNSNEVDEYFTKSKLERDTMYSQMIETYEKVLNSSNSLETQKQTATQEIQKINEIKNSIMICENLIKTKGFENNIIFVNGESVSVIIGANEMKQEEVAQIQNIISRELNAKIENIHIATK